MPSSPEPLSPTTIEFGRRVRERRHELGLSQEALAHQSGIHWTFIGQVERGRRNLTLHNIVRIAAALGIDPANLVSGMKPKEWPDGNA